jgi:hypothetical protein
MQWRNAIPPPPPRPTIIKQTLLIPEGDKFPC